MDGAPWVSADVAQGKAWTSAAYGVPSDAQKEKMAPMPNFAGAITAMTHGRFTPQTGAVPVYRDGAPTDTEAERRKALIGFAAGSFLLKDLASARDEATPPKFRELVDRWMPGVLGGVRAVEPRARPGLLILVPGGARGFGGEPRRQRDVGDQLPQALGRSLHVLIEAHDREKKRK